MKRAEELANAFLRTYEVARLSAEDCFKAGYAAAEKDALNSEVVKEIEIALQKCAAANERMSGAFNHEHTLSRIDIKTFAEIALEKLNKARG